MIVIDIPGHRRLELSHLVLDYNGTLAVDGKLLPGVADAIDALAARLTIHVVTADTFGDASGRLAGLPVSLVIAAPEGQDIVKLNYVTALGTERVAAIGNGRNDRRMVEVAALGIAVIQREGAAAETLLRTDVVCTSILDALDLLREPQRLIATLRS